MRGWLATSDIARGCELGYGGSGRVADVELVYLCGHGVDSPVSSRGKLQWAV